MQPDRPLHAGSAPRSAVTVVGGLLTSTLLTLLVIPALYMVVDDAQHLLSGLPKWARRLGRRRREQKSPALQPGPVAGGTG